MSNDWSDKSIEQPDIVAAADPQFNKNFGVYSLSKPHPGYGKDPNILNEYGHTKYPMWVDAPEGRKIVNNAQEESEAKGEKTELKQDGPTIKEFVDAGYKASLYPPKGYASKSTEAEIKEYSDKETKAGGW